MSHGIQIQSCCPDHTDCGCQYGEWLDRAATCCLGCQLPVCVWDNARPRPYIFSRTKTRQETVATLQLQGKNTREIAAELSVSLKSVRRYQKALLAKRRL